MLASTLEHYREQQRLTAAAVKESRKRSGRGVRAVAPVITAYQLRAISLSLQSTPDELSEQGVAAPPAAAISAASLVTTPQASATMLSRAANQFAFDRLIATLVQDAGRTASAVDSARRPGVTGWVRMLNPPSCSRCVVLAGRVYRFSDGFLRHPSCDCVHQPTTKEIGPEFITDPMTLIERGQVRGLSQADMETLELGGDLGQVVNVRRSQAGLTVGSSVVARAGRPTPQGVLRAAGDNRVAAIAGLRTHGYLL